MSVCLGVQQEHEILMLLNLFQFIYLFTIDDVASADAGMAVVFLRSMLYQQATDSIELSFCLITLTVYLHAVERSPG